MSEWERFLPDLADAAFMVAIFFMVLLVGHSCSEDPVFADKLMPERLPAPAQEIKQPSATAPKTKPRRTMLARVTFYAPCRDYGNLSSTGTRLKHLQHCAVDPSRIPYGSTINVPGIGKLRAVDTGSAVKSRKAARLSGRNQDERNALVIDVFVSRAEDIDRINRNTPDFLLVEIEN